MNELATNNDSVFYEFKDPDTGRKYKMPDLSNTHDLFKVIEDDTIGFTKHDPETKIRIAAMYCVIPSFAKLERLTGVPQETIRMWKSKPWWHVVTREIRKQKNEELDNNLTALLEDTVMELAERVHNGDTVLDKDGNERLVPLKARDLAVVMGITYEKRALLRADPHTKTKQTEVAEHLANVAAKLEKLVGKIPEPVTVDGEFEEVS